MAAADACHISRQPEKLQSASLDDDVEMTLERAEGTAADSMHQTPSRGQQHAPAVSWKLDVTSARGAASRQPHKPILCSDCPRSASEAAHAHCQSSSLGKHDTLNQPRSAAVANDKDVGRDSSPAQAGSPRHLNVQSALWRPPPPKARPLPPLPKFSVLRSTGLPSPSHDSACVQSLGAAMEVSTLFSDKPQRPASNLPAEKAPEFEPDTPDLRKEHFADPPRRSGGQKSEAGKEDDAGDAGAEGSHAEFGSPLTAVPRKSPEVAKLQKTLASLASLKLSLGTSSASPGCNTIASSAPTRTLPAGHLSHKAGDMQQVAASGEGSPSRSICVAEERAADASGAKRGASPEACPRIPDSIWIYNPAAELEKRHASMSPGEKASTDLSDPEQRSASKMGTGQSRRASDMAQKGSLPDANVSAGGLPLKERLRQVPAAAGIAPQGTQQKDGFNARCLEDAVPDQQV